MDYILDIYPSVQLKKKKKRKAGGKTKYTPDVFFGWVQLVENFWTRYTAAKYRWKP